MPPLPARAKRLAAVEEEVNRTLGSELATLTDVDETQQAVEVMRDWMYEEHGRVERAISYAEDEAKRRVEATDRDSFKRDIGLWVAVLVIVIWQIVDVVIRYV